MPETQQSSAVEQAGTVANSATPNVVIYSFGPFCISTHDRLLVREGEIVALPPMVVRTLLVLLSPPGELVTKEQLLEQVWGSTFVDPNSISQNILRLRKTLDPDLPAGSIATVPKRGYRFVADVAISYPKEVARTSSSDHAVATAEPAPIPSIEAAPLATPPPASRMLFGFRMRAVVLSLLAILVVAGLGIYWRMGLSKATAKTRPSIAILGFDDLNGSDPSSKTLWISTALAETLYSELSADPGIRLIPNGAIETLRKDLSIGRTTTLPPETVAEICKNLGCDLLVIGRYLVSDGKIRVDVALQDAKTGETVASVNRTDSVGQLLSVIAATGQGLRTRLGMPSLTETQQSGLLASEATQPDALRAYAEGMMHLRALDATAAKPFFEQAISLEPDYPLAHSGLSTAWAMLGYDAKAAEEAKKAFNLAGNLSREERLQVEAQYATSSGKWDEAVKAQQALAKEYPDNLPYGLNLVAALQSAGKAKDALGVIASLKKLPEPWGSDPKILLEEASAYNALGDYTRALPAAQAAVARARERHQGFVLAQALLKEGDALDRIGQHDNARARFSEAKVIATGEQDAAAMVAILRRDADSLRQTGDLQAARNELNEAIVTAREIGDRKNLIGGLFGLTQIYRREGNLPEQKRLTLETMQIAQESGDRISEGNALNDLANELNNMGDPDGAKAAYLQCLTLAKQLGDSRLESRALGNLGILAYTHGQLATGQNYIEQGLAVSRRMGETSSVAYKLGHYAAVLMYQGKLKEAQAALTERCALTTKSNEKIDSAACDMQLASLSRQKGDPRAGIAKLEYITSHFNTVQPAMDAWKALARARIALNDLPGAQDAVNHATELSKQTVNEGDFLIPLAIIRGHLQTKLGQDAEALKTLQAAQERAIALKLVPLELEARTALGELHMHHDKQRGQRELAAVVDDATKLGYVSLADQARGRVSAD